MMPGIVLGRDSETGGGDGDGDGEWQMASWEVIPYATLFSNLVIGLPEPNHMGEIEARCVTRAIQAASSSGRTGTGQLIVTSTCAFVVF